MIFVQKSLLSGKLWERNIEKKEQQKHTHRQHTRDAVYAQQNEESAVKKLICVNWHEF